MVELKDIDGIISLPAVEGRFKEILSVQKIKDTMTEIEYDGVVDTDFLILINELNDENERLKKENQMLKHTIGRNENYIARLTHKGEWKDTTKPLYRSISRGD